ncbi:MAG: hypothetical protein DWC06_01765 [Candidatus Poseidoniales archaeon]|nr:MAG: hypothetical protein DWC06_01765 [Candidatus Poseidoniales archaeon]
MAAIKPILTGVVGLLLLASLIGYSGEEVIDNVPKPDAGLCGVTKDAFSNVPGSGALIDIDVDVTWDDNTVWIGIIDVKTYDSLEKLGGNADGEIVSCNEEIKFIAGGPSSGKGSSFTWEPDGDEFHIMIGSMEEAGDEEEDDDDDPWPFDGESESYSFIDEFTVKVDYDASGGWGVIVILFLIEIGLVFLTAQDRR